MKITFLATIKGKKQYSDDYKNIIQALHALGYKVFYEHVTDYSQEQLDSMSEDERIKFHESIMLKIKESNIVVAEVSYSSMGVGYLISTAMNWSKPVVMLYKGEKPTNLLTTLEESKRSVTLHYDNITNLFKILKSAIEYLSEQLDIRFTMLLDPEIVRQLDAISKQRNISKSEYIRELIKRDKKNK